MRAAVMGAGSWGTAVAKVLVDAGTDTVIWARRPELADAINSEHVNPNYLTDITLPAELVATSSPVDALTGADIIVCGVPSQSLRENLKEWTPHIGPDASLVSLAKGIETGSLLRMSEVIAEVTGVPDDRIAVLTGPNLAHEAPRGGNRRPPSSPAPTSPVRSRCRAHSAPATSGPTPTPTSSAVRSAGRPRT